jgi:transcriptional regulator with XRE-family HTH domain
MRRSTVNKSAELGKSFTMSKYDSAAIANRVRSAREAAGLSQEDVARQLALTPSGYGHYERNRQTFTVEQIFRLSTILEKRVEWLLGLDETLSMEEGALVTAFRKIRHAETQQMLLEIASTVAARNSAPAATAEVVAPG